MVYISAIAFDCLRVWGITQHQWIPTILVFALSMFDPAVNIVRVFSNSGINWTSNYFNFSTATLCPSNTL